MAQEVFEERELSPGELQQLIAPPRAPGHQIDAQVASLNLGRSGLIGPPRECVNAGAQFLKGKWLGQVVVGAGAEGSDLALQIVTSREHQDWEAGAPGTDGRKHLMAIAPRQGNVQQHELDIFVRREQRAVFAVLGAHDLVAVSAQATLKHTDNRGVVFNQQNPHRREYMLERTLVEGGFMNGHSKRLLA